MSRLKSGHKRMMKYYKYHKKDSSRYFRQKEKQSRRAIDSLLRLERRGPKLKEELTRKGILGESQWRYVDSIQIKFNLLNEIVRDSTSSDSSKASARNEIKAITKTKINRELARGTLPGKRPYSMPESVRNDLRRWYSVLKDTTSSDSLRKIARNEIKNIAVEHAMKNPQFKAMYEQYSLYGHKPSLSTLNKYVPEIDTLQGIMDLTAEEVMKSAEDFATKEFVRAAGLEDFNKQAGEVENIKSQINDLTDADMQKAQAKQTAERQVQAEVNNRVLNSAQTKVSKLLDKYRSFTNSDDLSDAVKKTSLQGKTFKERLVIGGNFNVVSTDPVSLDLAPLIGYRLNTKFYLGLGVNYRHTFGDSLKYKLYVSPTNSSLRFFANYDVFRNFFVYGEMERAGLKLKANDVEMTKWKTNYFVGLGKKILITPKIFMIVTGLYEINDEKNNPTYPSRFQIRVGFQTSDLAFRKKKIYYNP